MNRKDTIIIAVLINAGLLALLFMMAINTDEEVITSQPALSSALADNQPILIAPLPAPSPSQPQQPQNTSPAPKILADAGSADEMDNFLKDLSSSHLAQSPYVDDESLVDLDSDQVHTIPPERSDEASSSDTRIVEVTVKRGDALEKIARSNGTTVEVIKKINKLSSSKLNIGQTLRIPVPVAAANRASSTNTSNSMNPANKPNAAVAVNISNAPKAVEPKVTVASESPQYYTIKSGDNPWKIAKEHKVKYDDILRWNNMDEEKARNLKVGDKIRVK